MSWCSVQPRHAGAACTWLLGMGFTVIPRHTSCPQCLAPARVVPGAARLVPQLGVQPRHAQPIPVSCPWGGCAEGSVSRSDSRVCYPGNPGQRRARLMSLRSVQPRHAEASSCLAARHGVHGHTSTRKPSSVPSPAFVVPGGTRLIAGVSVLLRRAKLGRPTIAGLAPGSPDQCRASTTKMHQKS